MSWDRKNGLGSMLGRKNYLENNEDIKYPEINEKSTKRSIDRKFNYVPKDIIMEKDSS